MKELIVVILITIPIVILGGVYVGAIQTFVDWLDEKVADMKAKREAKKLRKRRDRLWDMYSSLSLD